MDIRIKGHRKIKGNITMPGDKSISHRSAIIASIADGITEIDGFSDGRDCLDTLICLKNLGLNIDKKENKVIIYGKGMHLKRLSSNLYAGNSGTTVRLLSGILAGQAFSCVIDGDESLKKRPMNTLVKPLSLMGAHINLNEGKLPLRIKGGCLKAIDYRMHTASAQVKSALLLAGLYTDGPSRITEPCKSRNHTELMLESFGARLYSSGNSTIIYPAKKLTGQKIQVPGDISSAAFFIAAALITPASKICIRNVGLNKTRTGIIDAFKAMGGDIKISDLRYQSGELSGDIEAYSSALKGISVGGDIVPRLIDEIPVLAVAASLADGITVIKDAGELKVKESDRIATVATELGKMGACIKKMDDGLVISGVRHLHGAMVDSHCDHRLAMALAVAGLASDGVTCIRNFGCCGVSFPGFYKTLNSVCVQ